MIVKEKSSNSPPNVIDIIPSPPSPQSVGNTVKFYAYASDPEEDQILYKFYLKGPASVWLPVRDWINANWWEWTPVEPGDYEIQVWIRDGNHATSDGQDAYKMIPYEINPLPNLPNQPPTIMALTPNKPSPQVSGTAIEWTATASDPEKDTIFYRFDLHNSENLSIEGDWSTSNVWTWYSSASEEGLYDVCVYVKDGKHESHYGYDSYKCYYGFSLLMGPAGLVHPVYMG